MKVSNIYDEQLAAIEEVERKVRIAKRRLREAERELDETLRLVEVDTSKSFFFQIKFPNGKEFPVFDNQKIRQESGGNIYGFQSVVQDIFYEGKENALSFLDACISLAKKYNGILQVWNGRMHREFGTINLSNKSFTTRDGDNYRLEKGKVILTYKNGKTKIIKKNK